jgi:hypothetical protein
MTLNFAELRKQNLLRVALNTGAFAEKVDFYPQGGAAREIVINVIHGGENALNESSQEISTVERIRVRVAKDEAAADGETLIGGIAEPRLGDCIVRAGDSPDRAFAFVNAVGDTNESWLLLFQRQKREQVGTSNTRQRLS